MQLFKTEEGSIWISQFAVPDQPDAILLLDAISWVSPVEFTSLLRPSIETEIAKSTARSHFLSSASHVILAGISNVSIRKVVPGRGALMVLPFGRWRALGHMPTKWAAKVLLRRSPPRWFVQIHRSFFFIHSRRTRIAKTVGQKIDFLTSLRRPISTRRSGIAAAARCGNCRIRRQVFRARRLFPDAGIRLQMTLHAQTSFHG